MPTKGSGTRVPRNPVALSPLLRKGGVHEKSKTAKRQQTRQALSEQLDNWREELEFERELRSDSDLLNCINKRAIPLEPHLFKISE